MATVENFVNTERKSIATPIKVVLIGGVMAIIEGNYDIVNAHLYAGVFDGVEVTSGEIIVITGLAIAFALAMLYYAYAERHSPSKRVYIVNGVLSVLTLVVGGPLHRRHRPPGGWHRLLGIPHPRGGVG